jgi:hypothetical protein
LPKQVCSVHVKTLRSQKLRMLLTHRKLLQSKAIAMQTFSVSAGRSQRCQKAVDHEFPFEPNPDRSGQDPHPGELTSALSRAEVISPLPMLSADRCSDQHRSTTVHQPHN